MSRTLCVLVVLLLTACNAAPAPTPTAAPAIGVTVFPTDTLITTPTPEATPTPPSTATPVPTPTPARTEFVLAEMTLEQKVGQLMAVGFIGPAFTPELQALIEDLHIGGIFLFESNIQTPAQVAQLVNEAQRAAHAEGDPPLFVATDHEGGPVSRLTQSKGFIELPTAMAIAATGQVTNARIAGQVMADELNALGVNMNLAPVMDVNTNPANPIIGVRSFGSRPQAVAEFGMAMAGALQANGIIAVGKHFPGHGSTSEDSHLVLPVVNRDRDQLETVELAPFRHAIEGGISAIMSAHILFPALEQTPSPADLPATLSRSVLINLLRNDMRFDGLILTDALEMGALADNGFPLPEAAVRALNAGADVLSMNTTFDDYRAVHARIVQAVMSGEVPLEQLNDAARRVLRAKERFGLFEALLPDPELAAASIGRVEDRAEIMRILVESVTLARDDASLIPLAEGAPLFVIETPYAYGLSGSLGRPGMRVSAQPTPGEIASAVAQAQWRTVLVTTADVALNPTQADLVHALLNAGVPTIVWAVKSPYDVFYLKDAPPHALLATYGTAPYLLIDAVSDVLFGRAPARGVLPVDEP